MLKLRGPVLNLEERSFYLNIFYFILDKKVRNLYLRTVDRSIVFALKSEIEEDRANKHANWFESWRRRLVERKTIWVEVCSV